jgi:hypothetical protein
MLDSDYPDMTVNRKIRPHLGVLCCVVLAACSSATRDATGPAEPAATVTLTAGPTTITGLGEVALAATVTGDMTTSVRKVEFYERVDGVDATPRKLGQDSLPPYDFIRAIASAADDGAREFTAIAYDAAGFVAKSNPVKVVVNLAADTTTLRANFVPSHTVITSPGNIDFLVMANKIIARIQVYDGPNMVAEVVSPSPPMVARVAVTAAQNGTRSYVVKAYDLSGHVVVCDPMPVAVDIRWDFARPLEGVQSMEATSLATDATNAIYFAGTTVTGDIFLAKHDANGNREWIRNFGGSSSEYAYSVGVDPSGRVLVTGTVFQPAPSLRSDCFLTLYDADGKLLRTQIVDIPGWEKVGCVATTDVAGNFYLSGNVADSVTRQTDGFLIKYDKDGNTIWTRQLGSSAASWNDDVFTAIATDRLGGVYIAGYTNGSFDAAPNRSGMRDVFLVKYDADGNRQWSQQYGVPELDTFGQQLAADPDGGVYLVGQQTDPETFTSFYSSNDAVLLRYAADGTLRWAKTLDGGFWDYGSGVAADLLGVYIVGSTYGSVGPGHEITEPGTGAFLAKLSRDGELLSVRMLGNPAMSGAQGVAIGSTGGVYVSGYKEDPGNSIQTPVLARHQAF